MKTPMGKDSITPRGMVPLLCSLAAGLALSCSADPNGSESVAERVEAINTTLVNATFSDGNGWNQPQYYTTLKYLDMNNDGRSDVCGRGSGGITCALDDGTGRLGSDKVWSALFSDSNGWNVPQGYLTIAYPDLNGDGLPDICGRGTPGLFCGLSNGSGFGTISIWNTNFSDAGNWTEPRYYSTIQFADLNGDGKDDVCGRGTLGVWCGLSTGTGFGALTRWSTSFNDGAGWDAPQFYRTIRLADVSGDGRADICGRGHSGIYCAVSSGSAFGTPKLWEASFSDANGWTAPEYYSTIQFSDVNFDAKVDLCARGISGVLCATSTGTQFNAPTVWEGSFSDGNGWNRPQYYSTIHVDHGVLCGRGIAGIHCAYGNRSDITATGFTNMRLVSSNESDAGGWTLPQYYSTIALTPDFKITERGAAGVYSTSAVSGTHPNAPSNLRVAAISNKAFLLTWTDNSNDEIQFNVYSGGHPLGARLSYGLGRLGVGANVTSATFDSIGGFSLLANTKYCFTVRAFKPPHSSAASNVVCAKTLPNPTSPPPSGGHIVGTQTIDSVTVNCGTVTYTLDNSQSVSVTGTGTGGDAPGLFRCNYMAQFPNQSAGAHTLCLLSQGINTCQSANVTAGQITTVTF